MIIETYKKHIADGRMETMVKEGKIGSFEAFCMFVFLLSTKIFFTNTSVVIQLSGTAAWYTTLISCIASLLFFLLLYWLIRKFPNKNIVDIFKEVFGNILGSVITFIFFAYALFYSASVLREFVEMIKAYNLPYTPPSIIITLLLSVTSIYLFIGLEGISKISVLAFYPVLIGTLLLLLLGLPQYEPHYITPLLGYGVKHSLWVGLLRSAAYSEIFFLSVIVPSLKDVKIFKKVGIASLLFTGLFFSLCIALIIMAFNYTSASENLSNIFTLSRAVYYNRFIQRVESIFLFIWVIASVLNVSISAYMALSLYCKNFRIKNHRPLIPAFAVLLFLLTLLPQNFAEVLHVNLMIIKQHSLFFIFSIPVLALFLSVLLKKGTPKKKLKTR
jgi:spore germination protein KB